MKKIIISILLSSFSIMFSVIACIISTKDDFLPISIILFVLAFICIVTAIIILFKGFKKSC